MNPAVAYVAAILGIVAIESAALVTLRIFKVEIDQALLAQLLGIGTPTLVALLALLRGIGNSQEIQQAKQSVEQKVDQHHATVEAAIQHNTELTVETKRAVESGS